MQAQKYHFHLVAAEVMFSDPENNNAIGSIKLNTMLKTQDGLVRAKEIGKAQQAIQLALFQKLQDPNINVVDVFIMSVIDLGRMTEKYFTDMGNLTETPIDVTAFQSSVIAFPQKTIFDK